VSLSPFYEDNSDTAARSLPTSKMGYCTTFDRPGDLEDHVRKCAQDGSLDSLLRSSGGTIYLIAAAHRVGHCATAVLVNSVQGMELTLAVPRTENFSTAEFGWSGIGGDVVVGRRAGDPGPDQHSPDYSRQAVFVNGYYIVRNTTGDKEKDGLSVSVRSYGGDARLLPQQEAHNLPSSNVTGSNYSPQFTTSQVMLLYSHLPFTYEVMNSTTPRLAP